MGCSLDIVGALPVLSQLSPSQDLGFLPQGASWSASMSPKKPNGSLYKRLEHQKASNFSTAPTWTFCLSYDGTHVSPSFEGQVEAAPTSLSAQYIAPSSRICDRTLDFLAINGSTVQTSLERLVNSLQDSTSTCQHL